MDVPVFFGDNVFNDKEMRESLDSATYTEMKKCIEEEKPLSLILADKIAFAMKEWAIKKNATHFTHWFQPMTGVTAEKHDSFITPTSDCEVIMDFSGKELIKGESDASSFPSGGLRATFEARGYTAWDPTSYAFLKDGVLCIPTAFCSYNGLALDKKTPLLRSMEAINRQALRILRLFGKTDIKKVTASVGAEQEYFLIDGKVAEKRRDIVLAGRTLFGARPPKGQEFSHHYFGAVKPRVAEFMKELDEELWKLGVFAKTEHNEAAPAQHELAPVFCRVDLATDQNQLTMETMKKVAKKNGMECLLHEKPFQGVNGSGKHNNWSLSTDTGINLLNAGNNPYDNAQFLLFLVAVIKAVDENQDLLRISVASAGNDCRLGGNEAPPSVISMFLGDELEGILSAIADNRSYSERAKCNVKVGVHVLPKLSQDSTDRNRTSPFAFTGNKFEFRMVGSKESIACPNMILNTIVADALCSFADELEGAKNFKTALNDLIGRTYKEHRRIIFNGNNYSNEWKEEAERRGLLSLPTTADALPLYATEKNIKMFKKHGVLTGEEICSRRDILLENYCKSLQTEGYVMIDMARQEILPAVARYIDDLASTQHHLEKTTGGSRGIESQLVILTNLYDNACDKVDELEHALEDVMENKTTPIEEGKNYKDILLPAMKELRETVDELELNTSKSRWPFPCYDELLYSVK